MPLKIWPDERCNGKRPLTGFHGSHLRDHRGVRRRVEWELLYNAKGIFIQIHIPPPQSDDLAEAKPIQSSKYHDQLPLRPHDNGQQLPHLVHCVGVRRLALLSEFRQNIPGGVAADVVIPAGVLQRDPMIRCAYLMEDWERPFSASCRYISSSMAGESCFRNTSPI